MSLENINKWHQRARPNPTRENFGVQLGCHLEEVVEMLDAIVIIKGEASVPANCMTFYQHLKDMADRLKSGAVQAAVDDREELLDALADQIVTSVGVGHCASMDVVEACARVNASNWSKYNEDGNPIFKPNGKIDKGPKYLPPNLDGLY